ncbi:glycosyltransferase [Rhodobacterales bacterium FZCC0069]|nr:glycosyltransferase [Rhodobacterales bacterium FZCC0069]
MRVGIDATNIRHGGGLTHLIELLQAAGSILDPNTETVVVWAGRNTLDLLSDGEWLVKRSPFELNAGLIYRSFWQSFKLAEEAHKEGCDVLFVPGGSHVNSFHPVVTMNQNLLPFEWRELRRYGLSLTALKLLLLRRIQLTCLRRSEGVIFLTDYAQKTVENLSGVLQGEVAIIPHGLDARFFLKPREQFPITAYGSQCPFRVLYVSTVDVYKHQWHVVEAVARLRESTGWHIALDLVGTGNVRALARLQAAIERLDPYGQWVNYHGIIPHKEIHQMYAAADLGIWASSCETFGMILLEKMGMGLPIASSNRGPSPDILKDGGVYFNPEDPCDIFEALENLIGDPILRTNKSKSAFHLAHNFTWKANAQKTFELMRKVVQ